MSCVLCIFSFYQCLVLIRLRSLSKCNCEGLFSVNLFFGFVNLLWFKLLLPPAIRVPIVRQDTRMPKTSVSTVSQLRSFATEFERETLVYEKNSLICRGCGVVLGVADSNMKRSQVRQHIATMKHQKRLELNKKQKTLNFEADTFHRELCEVSCTYL